MPYAITITRIPQDIAYRRDGGRRTVPRNLRVGQEESSPIVVEIGGER